MTGFLALVGIATLLGYLVTPQPNLPGSFVYDLRFALLTFLAGAAALPIALRRAVLGPRAGAGVRRGHDCDAVRRGDLVRPTSARASSCITPSPTDFSSGFLFSPSDLGPFSRDVSRQRWLRRGTWIAAVVLALAVIGGGLPLERIPPVALVSSRPRTLESTDGATTVRHARHRCRAGLSPPLPGLRS